MRRLMKKRKWRCKCCKIPIQEEKEGFKVVLEGKMPNGCDIPILDLTNMGNVFCSSCWDDITKKEGGMHAC